MHPTPKSIHVLIPETCDYVTIHGKKDFEHVIKITDFKIESLPEKDVMIEG